MLPVLSGGGDNRPHRRVMLVLEANLVEYSLRARHRRLTGRRGLHPILVALLEATMEWKQEEGCRLAILARGLGALEGVQR